ncbi:MAG: aspartate aminotransferase family protein [Fimbriimonadaceae bacterium]|nr:aspartate aminotransferase family protein [Fimbriimonadaceae bacterium]
MTGEPLREHVVRQYSDHVNPYLAKLMQFAGFGVEVEAEGMYLTDQNGDRYLDFLGGYGVFSLGHRPRSVIDAVRDQLEKQTLSGKTFFNPVMAEAAARLAEITPAGLEYTFFSNSGAEAVEAALKFAKAATKRTGIVSTMGGYHGKTIGALSATGREKFRAPFEPLMPGVSFVPFGDESAMASAITDETAAVIVETVQGEGGVHVAPEGYLRAIRSRCDETGSLMIVDEVQTGFGRTGAMFGCDHEGVRPDIMTLAKALGGGVMPIGATLGTAEVWEKVFSVNPLAHTSTFGGNPLACAAAIASINAVQDQALPANAAARGNQLMSALLEKTAHLDLVAEVRGQGLLVGVEFNQDEVGELVIAQMVKRGVIAAYTLNNPRVIRMEPPLIVSEQEIEKASDVFAEAVQETSEILAAFA